LAPWIISHFPDHRIYVEPFGGAGSVLIRKQPSYAEIYNDLDDQVVNLFRVVRENGNELKRALLNTPFSRKEFQAADKKTNDNFEQARRTVIRSFMGFGSNGVHQKTGFRADSNRSGTTPAKDWANYPKALDSLISRLQGVVIEHRDAIDVMNAHDTEQTLHYVDPPYVKSTRKDKGDDYAHEMTDDQHVQLLDCLKSLKGKVVLSGYKSHIYDMYLTGWERVERKALADGASERTEVLWMNFVNEPDLLTFASNIRDSA
jgi:DNA adenine methylase